MAFNVADVRALIVLVVLAILAYVAHVFHYDTASTFIFAVIGILIIMYLNKLYHREVKKDYFSRYDKIEVPDAETTEEKVETPVAGLPEGIAEKGDKNNGEQPDNAKTL